MRKESLKKNNTNGVVEDASIDNDADINGAVDGVDADPLVSLMIIMIIAGSTVIMFHKSFKLVARR